MQLVKEFPAFHGTRRFITALTSVRHLSLSWVSPIQSIHPHPTYWRSILILSTHLRPGLPSGLFPSGFPSKTLYQLDAKILYFNTFITSFYMFRALLCSSSGGQTVLLQHLVSPLSLGDCSVHRLRESESPFVTCVLNSHPKTVTIPGAVLIQLSS